MSAKLLYYLRNVAIEHFTLLFTFLIMLVSNYCVFSYRKNKPHKEDTKKMGSNGNRFKYSFRMI